MRHVCKRDEKTILKQIERFKQFWKWSKNCITFFFLFEDLRYFKYFILHLNALKI